MSGILVNTPLGERIWHENWGDLTRQLPATENGRTHGVAVTEAGAVVLFRQAEPSLLVFDTEGRLLSSFGSYPGAHGLTLIRENGQERLWITDEHSAAVHKLSMTGKVLLTLSPPPYAKTKRFSPTWVAVNPGSGEIWVADGYGCDRLSVYTAEGRFIRSLGDDTYPLPFKCPHGIWFDSRKITPELYVADRTNRRIQVLDAEGHFLRSFGSNVLTSPDGFCRDGEYLIVPELHGRVSVFDNNDLYQGSFGDNGGIQNRSGWPDRTELMAGKFNSPHAAAAGPDGSLYVVEWRLRGRVIKLAAADWSTIAAGSTSTGQ